MTGRLRLRRRRDGRVEQLERLLTDARREQAAAELHAEQARQERDKAWEHVAVLTRRLAALDGDRLRAERDDLLLENAILRGRLILGDREELLRARETIARLTARLDAASRGIVTV